MFWEQPQLASNVQTAHGMPWDPVMIRWFLYLRHLSSGAYNLLRESGVVSLPSQRTLRDYTYYTSQCTGFSGICVYTCMYMCIIMYFAFIFEECVDEQLRQLVS
jgi:hypothetical protein